MDCGIDIDTLIRDIVTAFSDGIEDAQHEVFERIGTPFRDGGETRISTSLTNHRIMAIGTLSARMKHKALYRSESAMSEHYAGSLGIRTLALVSKDEQTKTLTL